LRAVAGGSSSTGSDTQIALLSAALILSLAQAGAGEVAKLQQTRAESGSIANGPVALLSTRQNGAQQMSARLAVRYIHDNLYRRLPLEEIAAQVHVSPRHLSRLLQHLTGVSPAVYIEQARIDRAAALLRHSDTPIKEIANEVGYADVHHFTRVFTRRCGVSPGAFRSGDSGSRHQGKESLRKPYVRNIQKSGALI
jgi:AraC family L-rhamnose operon transcriptional activator RhaR